MVRVMLRTLEIGDTAPSDFRDQQLAENEENL